MSGERVERRLAAILAADIVGYSRLMGRDEVGTLSRIRSHRREFIDPKIAEHKGRIVKTTGDGLLIEFTSVIDAVRCAAEWQSGMTERTAADTDGAKIEFRIGINVGDVVVEDSDIFGDGVNIAARLEGLAEPGGICVSARVREDAAGKLDVTFEDLGEQNLKNIARPLRAYAVTPASLALTSCEKIGFSIQADQIRPPLSIIVLPFANLSNDPEQEYFADAITDDLTTDLSRIVGSVVIARSTAFTYRGQSSE
jgi:adenylate cyclase